MMSTTLLICVSSLIYADSVNLAEVRSIPAHEDTTRTVAFSPDGKTLATGGYDNLVRLWDVATARLVRSMSGHMGKVLCVDYSPDGKRLVSAGMDGVRVWNLDDQTTSAVIQPPKLKSTLCAAFSSDGQTVVAGGDGTGTLTLWNSKTGKQNGFIDSEDDELVFAISFSPDGKLLAVVSRDIETEYEIVRTPKGLTSGDLIAGQGSTITVYQWPDLEKRASLKKIRGVIWSLDFAPDGHSLVYGGDDGGEKSVRLSIWDLQTGRDRSIATSHADHIHGVAWSPNGKLIVTGAMDNTLKLFRTATGEELATMRGHTKAVKSVAYSPDGRFVASGSWDGTARLWDVSPFSE